jgi:RNA polymerase sigma-70 factor (ECF subfamily)
MDTGNTQVLQHIPALRRYARALTSDTNRADDLVQDSLERALQRFHLYQNGTNLKAWLFTIMHNVYVNNVRKSCSEPNFVSYDTLTTSHHNTSDIDNDVTMRDLKCALTKLPNDQKNILLLVGLEGFGYKEVSHMLDIPLGTVMSRLHRAREKLRQQMFHA